MLWSKDLARGGTGDGIEGGAQTLGTLKRNKNLIP